MRMTRGRARQQQQNGDVACVQMCLEPGCSQLAVNGNKVCAGCKPKYTQYPCTVPGCGRRHWNIGPCSAHVAIHRQFLADVASAIQDCEEEEMESRKKRAYAKRTPEFLRLNNIQE
jgi:hypothetical protein